MEDFDLPSLGRYWIIDQMIGNYFFGFILCCFWFFNNGEGLESSKGLIILWGGMAAAGPSRFGSGKVFKLDLQFLVPFFGLGLSWEKRNHWCGSIIVYRDKLTFISNVMVHFIWREANLIVHSQDCIVSL